MAEIDPSELAKVISPLRRTLLRVARRAEGLPDIPDAQIEILRRLPEGSASSPGELAEALSLSRPTISNLLKAMVSGGLVTRQPTAADGRAVEVRASQRALDILRRFDAASEMFLGEALDTISSADREAIAAALAPLRHLQAALDSPATE